MQIKTITLSLEALATLISLPEGVLIAATKNDSSRFFEIVVADPNDLLPTTAVFDMVSRKWQTPPESARGAPPEPKSEQDFGPVS